MLLLCAEMRSSWVLGRHTCADGLPGPQEVVQQTRAELRPKQYLTLITWQWLHISLQ